MKKLFLLSLFLTITFFTFNRAECGINSTHFSKNNEFKPLEELKNNVLRLNEASNTPDFNLISVLGAPLNDDICNAEVLTVDDAPTAGDVSCATLETNETGGFCWLSTANNTVWYSFVAPGSGLVEITTEFATGLDNSQMTLYAVIDCADFQLTTEVGCSENNGFTGSGNMAVISTAFAPLIGGLTYHIQVDGFGAAVGDFEIQVKELPPSNDDCATAKLLATNGNGSLISQFFAAATDSGGGTEACDNNSTANPADIWYEIQTGGSVEDLVVVVEPGINSDIVVAIYDSCVSQFPEACVDLGGLGGAENINLSVTSEDYYLRIYEKAPSGESLEIGVQGEILPIVLDHFRARAEKKGNKVEWSTLSETNSDYIEVQNSPNGSTKWETIGIVTSKGESTSRVDYELFDHNPYEVTYYRLNAVDKDGKSEVSMVISVRRSDVLGKMIISPNPARLRIAVQATSAFEENGTINVVDMAGKIVMKKNVGLRKGLNTINLDLDNLEAAGLYLISLQMEDGLQIEKFVKQ